MRERHSPHGANTPGLDSVLAHRAQLRPLSALSTRSFAGASTAVATLDPDPGGDLAVAVLPEQRPTFAVPATPQPKGINLQHYADLWNGGADSVRKLMDAAHITNYKALDIRRRLVKAHMIEVE